jgi:DNA helicase IV
MDLKKLKRFAEQDLNASRSAVREAERRIESISKAIEKEGKDLKKSPKIQAFQELSKKPFGMRIDYKDADTNLIQTFYLTRARENILTDSVKVHPWTSRLAPLRHLDVGDDEITKIAGKERHITLMLKGEYDQSAPDIKNATYLLRSETLLLESAMALLGESPPSEDDSSETGAFGLRELVLQTDFEQDSTMRFPMKGFLRIEGVPGSGKTTVALQRIPYLIDRQYDELRLSNDSEPVFSEAKTLVLVLNEVLEIYLRRLLDDLNVRKVDIVSFNSFIAERFLAGTGYLSGPTIVSSSESSPWFELTKTRYEILQPLNIFARRFVEDQLKPTLPRLLDEFSLALPKRFKSFSRKVTDVAG